MNVSRLMQLQTHEMDDITANPLNGLVREWRGKVERIDTARILRVHKYREITKVKPIIVAAAEKASSHALELCSIAVNYVVKPISCIDPEGLVLADGTRFTNPVFERHLEGCDHLLAFVADIGPNLDQEVIRLINDEFEPLDALLLETTGWLTIEAGTKNFARDLKHDLARHGYGMSLRMGPGYEYALPDSGERVRWNLEEQRELFQMFGNYPLSVTLMDSCAMQPKMSRSGVFGLRPLQ